MSSDQTGGGGLLSRYFFAFLSILFLIGAIGIAFSSNLETQWSMLLVLLVLAILFLLAAFRLEYAFFLSLILLPVFFLLENISVIDQVYNTSLGGELGFAMLDVRIVGFLIAILFSFLLFFKNKRSFFQTPLSKTMPVVIGFFCLSALWSVGGQEKYVQVCFFLLLLLLYFVAYFSVKNFDSFVRLLAFILLLSVPAILLAYYQIFGNTFYEYSDLELQRVSGPFNSPNQFGSFLLVTLALSTTILLSLDWKKYSRFKKPLIFYFFLSLPIFVLTFSRSAWIGIVVFLFVFSLQKKRLLAGVLVVFGIILTMMMSFDDTRDRINGIFQRSMFDSVYAREEIWRLSYQRFKEKPLLGYGTGSFAEVIRDAKESGGGTENPHNDVVFFAVETGLIGAVCFLFLMFGFYSYLIKSHLKLRRESLSLDDPDKKNFLIMSFGIVALFVSLTIVGLVESYYEGNLLHLLVWPLLAGWFSLLNKKTTTPL